MSLLSKLEFSSVFLTFWIMPFIWPHQIKGDRAFQACSLPPLTQGLLSRGGLGEWILPQVGPGVGCHCLQGYSYRHIGNRFVILSLTGMQSQLLSSLCCSLGFSVFRCVVKFLCKWDWCAFFFCLLYLVMNTKILLPECECWGFSPNAGFRSELRSSLINSSFININCIAVRIILEVDYRT